MSEENVERFRRIYEEWYARHELGPGFLAEEVDWINPHDAVERGIRKGADSFNDAIRSVFEAWEDARFETDRIIESGEVIALGHVRGRGRTAGLEVSRAHGEIWTFRDGRVIRMRWFHRHSETLKAAGLSE